jgi:hypothetical protein
MKKFLWIVGVGLIVVHAHGADRRLYNRAADSRQRNALAQSQQLNQPRSDQQQSTNPLAQTQSIPRSSLASSQHTIPAIPENLSVSTPVTATVRPQLGVYGGKIVELIHPYFHAGRGIVMRESVNPGAGYRKNGTTYMLFCTQKVTTEQKASSWRIGLVASPEKDGITLREGSNLREGSKPLFEINITDYVGDLFAAESSAVVTGGVNNNLKRREEYGVVKPFDTQEAALTFIHNNSEKFFKEYFAEIDKAHDTCLNQCSKGASPSTKNEVGEKPKNKKDDAHNNT